MARLTSATRKFNRENPPARITDLCDHDAVNRLNAARETARLAMLSVRSELDDARTALLDAQSARTDLASAATPDATKGAVAARKIADITAKIEFLTEAETSAIARYNAASAAWMKAHAAVWRPVLEAGARRRVEAAEEIGRLHAALFAAEQEYYLAVETTMIACEHGAELRTDVVGALDIGMILNPETPNAGRDRQFFKYHLRGPVALRGADAEAGGGRQESAPVEAA